MKSLTKLILLCSIFVSSSFAEFILSPQICFSHFSSSVDETRDNTYQNLDLMYIADNGFTVLYSIPTSKNLAGLNIKEHTLLGYTYKDLNNLYIFGGTFFFSEKYKSERPSHSSWSTIKEDYQVIAIPLRLQIQYYFNKTLGITAGLEYTMINNKDNVRNASSSSKEMEVGMGLSFRF